MARHGEPNRHQRATPGQPSRTGHKQPRQPCPRGHCPTIGAPNPTVWRQLWKAVNNKVMLFEQLQLPLQLPHVRAHQGRELIYCDDTLLTDQGQQPTLTVRDRVIARSTALLDSRSPGCPRRSTDLKATYIEFRLNSRHTTENRVGAEVHDFVKAHHQPDRSAANPRPALARQLDLDGPTLTIDFIEPIWQLAIPSFFPQQCSLRDPLPSGMLGLQLNASLDDAPAVIPT